MVELIAIKSGHDYIRMIGDGFELCGLNKATVYPLDKLDEARESLLRVKPELQTGPQLVRLSILEEPFVE